MSDAGSENSTRRGPSPRASATAASAASSSVAAMPGTPGKYATLGLARPPSASASRAATAGPGGLPSSTITSVAASAASAASARSAVDPPTASERSRPPTPIACETPSPSAAMRQLTSCRPVPDAATRPMRPRGTALAKPSGTPPSRAEPQSGPITKRPRVAASRLSATSVATGTLSLKSITCRPAASARRASAPA